MREEKREMIVLGDTENGKEMTTRENEKDWHGREKRLTNENEGKGCKEN